MRTPKEQIPEISDWELHFLSDGLQGAEDQANHFSLFLLKGDSKACKALWQEHGPAILGEWIAAHPGTRPSLWWEHDAPHPARKRLGGIGTPCHEVLAYGEAYTCGLPDHWVSKFAEAYYNGRARDIHGNLIECQWKEGDFSGKAIDPKNPPTFESQAAFLRRHNLFAPGEEKRLRPRDFEPETIGLEIQSE